MSSLWCKDTDQSSKFESLSSSSNVSAMLNGTLYCQKKPIALISNLKYIGNSETKNEPFFEFRELKIFNRIISHDEYSFLSREERVTPRKNIKDDRVSYFDLINLIYDEFTDQVSPNINFLLEMLAVCPGDNFISAIEIINLMCRNGKVIEVNSRQV